MPKRLKYLIVALGVFFSSLALGQTQEPPSPDPLQSWNNTPNKQQLIHFVNDVSNPKSANFTPVSQRIVTIDNDGTLWLEQPMYIQAIFAIDEIKALSPQHPEWKTQQPFKGILEGDQTVISTLSMQDFEKILALTHSGMSVQKYQQLAKDWLEHSKNPRFKRPYTQLVYQPMLELIRYLHSKQFKIYIVSGGGQDFIRSFAPQVYGIPTEQIIGTAGKTQYQNKNNQPELIKLPEILFIDDKQGKPEAINLFIGQQPLMAFGNSDGDRQMLEWTQARKGPHFMMLIHHDDAVREYAYGPKSKVGTFSDSLMQEAEKQGWNVVSMKNDWRQIFINSDETSR